VEEGRIYFKVYTYWNARKAGARTGKCFQYVHPEFHCLLSSCISAERFMQAAGHALSEWVGWIIHECGCQALVEGQNEARGWGL
jgi:hypothetical protein